jgi:RimJ/RimL family protein N-acetyltransferase
VPSTLPPIIGRHVLLRTVEPQDYSGLYRLCTGYATSYRWRFRGATPSPEEFSRALWQEVLAQFVIIRANKPTSVAGLVVAYNPDFRNDTVHVGIVLDPAYQRKAWPLEGLALFVDYVFTMWRFRKIYFESPASVISEMALSLETYTRREGVLVGHEFLAGSYVDLHILALWREDWTNLRGRALPTPD